MKDNSQSISLCLTALEEDLMDCIELCKNDENMLCSEPYSNFKKAIISKFKDILDMDLNEEEVKYIASVLVTELTNTVEQKSK
jgi:hypothetical protein